MAPASTEPCAVNCAKSTCAIAGESIDSTNAIVPNPANIRFRFMTFLPGRLQNAVRPNDAVLPLPLQRVKYLPPGEFEPCICEWQLAHCWLITKIDPLLPGSLG